MRRIHLAAFLILATSTVARAHNSWLIADRTTISDADRVRVLFMTGETFPVISSPTDEKRLVQFVELYNDQRNKVNYVAEPDGCILMQRPIKGPGLHEFACALEPRVIELDARTFEDYLRAERAEAALAEWQKMEDKPPSVSEKYTKFAKTFVQVLPGKDNDKTYEEPVGQRLEIIPLTNPLQWRSGHSGRIRVLLDGNPWPDISVSAAHEGMGPNQYSIVGKTDRDGIAHLTFDSGGHWFIKAHLIRPSTQLGRVGWESFWSTMTFRIGGEPVAAVEVPVKTVVVTESTDDLPPSHAEPKTETVILTQSPPVVEKTVVVTTPSADMVSAIRLTHGRVTPGAIIGYRIGKAARARWPSSDGSYGIVEVHCPMSESFTALADGLQAAGGVSLGRLSLKVEQADRPDIRIVFRPPGRTTPAIVRLRPAAIRAIDELGGSDADTGGGIAAMPDDQVFDWYD